MHDDTVSHVPHVRRLEVIDIPMKKLAINTNNLVEGYRSGLTGHDLARQFDIGLTTVWRILKKAGIKARSRIIEAPINEIIAFYQGGNAVSVVAKKFNLSSPTIVRRLKQAGCSLRSGSDAMYIRMARSTADERLALTKAAHDAVRGSAIASGIVRRSP